MARVLIVDDEDAVRMTLVQTLQGQNHEVFEASDGDKALKFLSENDVDLVVSDIVMPNREGLETIQEIRSHWPDIKIIAMSGGGRVGNTKYLDIAPKIGADAVLKKPFAMAELKDMVFDVLARDVRRDA